ncbi:hypothetical protein MHBO_003772, partial [Bonamia ostreae]
MVQTFGQNWKFHTEEEFVKSEDDIKVHPLQKRILKRESHLHSKNLNPDITGKFRNPHNAQGNASIICIPVFKLDKNDVKKAREQIDSDRSEEGHGFLFQIHLNYPSFDELTKNLKEPYKFRNDFLHWQFVQKKETFLAQLPVDFDLITFNLLMVDKEERVLPDIHVSLNMNDSNCEITDDNKHLIIDAMHTLLWKEMLANFTTYILCNRQFETSKFRNITYYLTTIWIGYDLNCTRDPSKGGKPIYLKKDDFPLVAPFISFFLSLQFVWIFVILEIGKRESDHQDVQKEEETNESSRERENEDMKGVELSFNYKEGDRPY